MKERCIVDNPLDFGKVGVVMGGPSAEREISLKSGKAVLSALLARQVRAIGIEVGAHPLKLIKAQRLDRVFNIVHGRGGEDGVLQGLLDSIGLSYTGSGVLGSALAMDKMRTKLCWRGAGLKTPDFCVLKEKADLDRCSRELGFPVIVKPTLEGSSIGIRKAINNDELSNAWEEAAQYNCEIFAETWINGDEYTAGVLNNKALPLIRLQTPHQFYDYEAKYDSTTTQYLCPCGLEEHRESDYQQIAMAASKTLGVTGWGRVDFLVDENREAWFIELNTVPGMTDHSLVPIAAKAAGIEFNELVWRILETSFSKEVSHV